MNWNGQKTVAYLGSGEEVLIYIVWQNEVISCYRHKITAEDITNGLIIQKTFSDFECEVELIDAGGNLFPYADAMFNNGSEGFYLSDIESDETVVTEGSLASARLTIDFTVLIQNYGMSFGTFNWLVSEEKNEYYSLEDDDQSFTKMLLSGKAEIIFDRETDVRINFFNQRGEQLDAGNLLEYYDNENLAGLSYVIKSCRQGNSIDIPLKEDYKPLSNLIFDKRVFYEEGDYYCLNIIVIEISKININLIFPTFISEYDISGIYIDGININLYIETDGIYIILEKSKIGKIIKINIFSKISDDMFIGSFVLSQEIYENKIADVTLIRIIRAY